MGLIDEQYLKTHTSRIRSTAGHFRRQGHGNRVGGLSNPSTQIFTNHRIKISMDGPGACPDNVAVERLRNPIARCRVGPEGSSKSYKNLESKRFPFFRQSRKEGSLRQANCLSNIGGMGCYSVIKKNEC